MKNKGFTLVELLVVVAIIAILSVIGLTIFSGAQLNARDARRKSDIDAIANVLETTRPPGVVFYASASATVSLPASGFSAGTVPLDNNGSTTAPNYCIRTSTATTAIADVLIANWATSAQCPTLPLAGSGESSWTPIPAAGFTTNGTGSAPFVNNTILWKVCARLESGAVYCKPSSQ